MAVKDRIPTPTDIKKGPIQFTNEEIEKLRNLQARVNQTTVQFGQLAINKLKLEEAENTIKKQPNLTALKKYYTQSSFFEVPLNHSDLAST